MSRRGEDPALECQVSIDAKITTINLAPGLIFDRKKRYRAYRIVLYAGDLAALLRRFAA
jgi:hypothetical protein